MDVFDLKNRTLFVYNKNNLFLQLYGFKHSYLIELPYKPIA